MPLSDVAAREIANVLRKYLEQKTVEQIVNELLEIRGDKDFRDTIESLVDALRMSNR
jgi:16S rRNA C1402 N4-methylase RsmH